MINIDKIDSTSIEITYSYKQYRPSKSLIDEELYTKYKKINNPINLYETLYYLHLKECINYSHINNVVNDDHVLIDNEKYKLLSLSDNCFINNKHIEEINNAKNIIISLDNLHNYIKVQLFIYLSTFFEKAKLIFSKFNTNVILILINRKNLITLVINEKKYIRDLNIKVENELQSFIYTKNNDVLDKLVSNSIIINSELAKGDIEKIYTQVEHTNNYYLNYVTNKYKDNECSCKHIYYNLFLKCYVCEKCYAMHYLDEDLVLDHSSAADLNPFL